MFFHKSDVYPSKVWFITVTAFKSVGLLRNNYFKISSNAPSNLLCNVWNFIFYFSSAVFRCLSNDIALKGFLLQHCVVIFIILRCDTDFWTVFLRGLIRPDFAAIGREKFAARYFWFKAKLKQKKFIFKWYSVISTWAIKISRFYF